MRERLLSFMVGALLVSTLLLAPLLPAAAADIQFGGITPGGPVYTKSMLSLRELRYVNMVEQHTDFSCGAAALATILNYAYGKDLTEYEVIEGMLKVSDPEIVREKGFSLLDMKRYIETFGMRGRGYEVTPATLEKIKIPVIALLDIKGYKHFVVLKKTQDGRVYLGDPALGNRVMSQEEFVAGWNGIVFAVIGRGFIQNTVLINPPEPLTAKRLKGVYSQATTAQLLEFGFTHADLF